MSLPLPPNTTCDIYRNGDAPPAPADVAGVECYLDGNYDRKVQQGHSQAQPFRYTHIMYVSLDTDIRDGQNLWATPAGPDAVYVPNGNGTKFIVTFVETININGPLSMKKVYLHRCVVTWPTNDL